MMTEPSTELIVPPDAAGRRLDAFLGEVAEIGSRSRAARLIEQGRVSVDGGPAKKRHELAGGERVAVSLDDDRAIPVASVPAVKFAVVHEDDDLIVIDKPAGLVVHPAPGHHTGTLAQALAGRAGGGDAERPGIVHRLDKDTSGLMVVARNDTALRALQAALKRREVTREYLALVKGHPESPSGTIDAPLGRDRRSPTQIAVRQGGGRHAVTHFSVERELPQSSLLRVRLETGRTHQIRVHLAAIGLPVFGDPRYGVAGALGLERQFLHAARLEFDHPASGERLSFESPLPADLQAALLRAQAGER